MKLSGSFSLLQKNLLQNTVVIAQAIDHSLPTAGRHRINFSMMTLTANSPLKISINSSI